MLTKPNPLSKRSLRKQAFKVVLKKYGCENGQQLRQKVDWRGDCIDQQIYRAMRELEIERGFA